MEKLRRFLCAFVAATVLLTGCGSNVLKGTAREEVPMGRYMETDITPIALTIPQAGRSTRSVGIFPHKDGKLDYLALETLQEENGKQRLLHYRSMNSGATWEPQNTDWFDLLYKEAGAPQSNMLLNLTMGEQEQIYCIILSPQKQMRCIKVFGGQASEIKIPEWRDENFYTHIVNYMTHVFSILPNGDIVLALEQSGEFGRVYDGNNGEIIHRFETGRFPAAVSSEAFIRFDYVQSERADGLIQSDFDGNQLMTRLMNFNPKQGFLLFATNNTVLFVNASGIYQIAADLSEEPKQLLEGSMYSFASPSIEMKYFSYGTYDNNFYLILKDKKVGGEKLYRYHYDPSVSLEPMGRLAIFALQDCNTLRQAISLYQVKHPEQKIDLEIGLVDGTAVTKEDVIRVLNTELLSKKGPDVLILDGLPITTYIEKGILTDLSDISNQESYFQNITNAYATEQGTCAIPARYIIPLMTGPLSLLDNAAGLPEIAELAKHSPPYSDTGGDAPLLLEKRPLFYIYTPSDIIQVFFYTYAATLLSADHKLNKEALSELLTYAKIIYESSGRQTIPELKKDAMDIQSFFPEDVYGERALLGIQNVKDFEKFIFWAQSKPMQNGTEFISPELIMKPLCGPVDHIFIPACVASVNHSSTHQEAAKEFIKVLLSDDVQKPFYSEGFPVNKFAFQFGIARTSDNFDIRYGTNMEELAMSLKVPVTLDSTILEAILNESDGYFRNQKSLEQTVDKISSVLGTYLAEKS